VQDPVQQRDVEAARFAAQEMRHRRVSWWYGVARLILFAFAMFSLVQTFRSDVLWLPRAVLPATLAFFAVVVAHRRVQQRQETARRCRLLAQESAGRLRGGSGPGASVSIPSSAVSALDAGDATTSEEVAHQVLPDWAVMDLGVEGVSGLLQRLNTTQSTLGARRLRRLLRSPLQDVEAIESRQSAVAELAQQQVWRDALLLAFFEGRSTPMRRLPGFLALPRLLPGGAARWLLGVSALLTLPVVVVGIGTPALLPLVVLTVLPGLLVRLRWRQHLLHLRESWLEMGPVLKMVDQVGRVLDQMRPSSPVLQAHAAALDPESNGASGLRLSRLRRCIALLRLHEIGFLYGLIEFLFQWDLQWLAALEAEAGARRDELERLTAGLVELEALLALAVWSAEQPGCVFPEIVRRDTPWLDIGSGEHPLLRHGDVVPNDITLGDSVRVELVTGSNMAGKSTFLRMVMLNALLAQVGSAVRARRMRMTPLSLQANINVSDSLADGKSYFLVEVERVHDMLQVARTTPFVLSVFDELFRGTNSNERLAASREIARLLAAHGGLCLLATHDLELTRLVQEEQVEGMAALHFRDEIRDGRMVFPYVAHRGVSGVHNALRVLELAGYPTDLVQRARRFAEEHHPHTASDG
jgi:hypothetical protein